MKLHKEQRNVERGGVGEETTFQMKTSAKAFDILSTGLYTDNILAIVRELSCNAYDAHVDAGKSDVPFEVHLPNNLEPWFGIKDFGVGLSDEDLRTVYTTYFDSTKTNSNAFIGALGLGSKSPFSYTQSFQVIARYNGQRRTYAAFINDNGIPSITQMGETLQTDEPNGLEVIVTVQAEDFRRFADKAAAALKWFPVKPIVRGAPHFRFEELPESTFGGSDWKLLPRDRYDTPPMTAVQGNVAYRVDLSQLSNLTPELERVLRQGHLVGFFDIGELEVAASREEIRYDKRSVQALEKRITSFSEELIKSLEDRLEHLSTNKMWDGFIEIDKIVREIFGPMHRLSNIVPDVSKTNNKVLRAYLENGGRFPIPAIYGYDLWVYRVPYAGSGKRLSREPIFGHLVPANDKLFFYNDMKNGGVGRMFQYLKDNGKRGYTIFAIVPKKDPKKPVERQERDDQTGQLVEVTDWKEMTNKDLRDEYKTLIQQVGNPTVNTVSVDAPHVPRSKSTNRGLQVYLYGTYHNYRNRSSVIEWERVTQDELDDFDLDDGGLYVPLRASAKPNSGTYQKTDDLHINPDHYRQRMIVLIKTINAVKGTDYTFDRLLHAGKSSAKKLEKKGWKNIIQLVPDLIPSYYNGLKFNEQVSVTIHQDDIGLIRLFRQDWDRRNCTQSVLGRLISNTRNLDQQSAFRTNIEPVIKAFEQYWNIRDELDTLRQVCHSLNIQGLPSADDSDALYNCKQILDTYPMLAFVEDLSRLRRGFGHQNTVDIDKMFDYISVIDENME